MGAVEDVIEWSTSKLSPWRQDALRRFAISGLLTDQDQTELLGLVKEAAGFAVDPKPPAPIALAKTHFATATGGAAIKIKAIQNVTNVNRLTSSAELKFAPDGLTIIYGRNGSGKSGFVRIFRTACRTRSDNRAKLKVLSDVYGTSSGPQEAEIVIGTTAGDDTVPWKAGEVASDSLLQVAVFDSSAADLYVDGGNQIQFLPFGLSLPHKLNTVCATLKATLEAERRLVTEKLALATIEFEQPRATTAQKFYSQLSGETTDSEISSAAVFSAVDQDRLDELVRLLSATATSSTDLTALSNWVKNLASECKGLALSLGDVELERLRLLKQQAVDARNAAALDAGAMFSGEPLPGVGSETWRRLWVAARDYSITEAYPSREFPVLNSSDVIENCVLCHQPLSEAASDRSKRFQAYIGGVLAAEADKAEAKVAEAAALLNTPSSLYSKDWDARIDQVAKRDAILAAAVSDFKGNVVERLSYAKAILIGGEDVSLKMAVMLSPDERLAALSQFLAEEAEALASADNASQREILLGEQSDLVDRKLLAASLSTITVRRDLLTTDALYQLALNEVQTSGITKKANDLIDVHLTKAVIDRYEVERGAFDIKHLKVGLARKSDQTKAAFQTTPGTTLTKLASDILSEGEQRALALAAFLTEVAVTEGSGPIVIDDPVSSLDRDRGNKVAMRLAAEALSRQVIVFTHDLVFFNDLCREADALDIDVETISLFSDANGAGKIDPAGVMWRGLNVKKRIGRLRSDFAPKRKLHGSSPSDYEVAIKNLYGRLRDTYERLVEEYIFCDVVRRGVDRVETQKLRMVHLSNALAIRFHDGMSKANTYSHDNPASETVSVPSPAEFEADLAALEALMEDLKTESEAISLARPSMKAK